MKQIFSLILFITISILSFAQNATYRFTDKSGTNITYIQTTLKDTTGNDTAYIIPNGYITYAQIDTVKDSLSVSVSSISKCNRGDILNFLVINGTGTGHTVKFIGSLLVDDGSVSLTTKKSAYVSFVFTGKVFIEIYRKVE